MLEPGFEGLDSDFCGILAGGARHLIFSFFLLLTIKHNFLDFSIFFFLAKMSSLHSQYILL